MKSLVPPDEGIGDLRRVDTLRSARSRIDPKTWDLVRSSSSCRCYSRLGTPLPETTSDGDPMRPLPRHAGSSVRLVGLLAASVLAGGCAGAVAGTPVSLAGAGDPSGAATQARGTRSDDLRWFEEMLLDSAVPAPYRQDAALRLIRSGTEESASIINRALDGGDAERRALIADALKIAGPLSSPLARSVTDAAAAGRLGPEVASAVLAVSGEIGTAEIVERFRAESNREARARLIEVLGRLADPMAPGVLVEAMRENGDSAEVERIDAALRRWSNSKVSRTPAAWTEWWNRLNVQGDGAVALRQLTNRIVQESFRADAAVTRAEAAEARAERLAAQLAEVHARLLALLPEEERMTRVQTMLSDEEIRIRSVAIGQIERMLRDAKQLAEPVRKGLIDRLSDSDPGIRIKAAKVLDTIGGEDLGPTLVRSLQGETDVEVVRSGLLVLGNRPQPAAVDFAVAQLRGGDSDTIRLAGRVLATLAGSGLLHPDDQARIRTLVAEGLVIDSRDLARLTVLVADDPDHESIVSLVDSPIEAVQRGAAEAYRTLGRRELLHQHAGTPTVARVAVQAWADAEVSPNALVIERLMELRPEAPDDAPAPADLSADLDSWRAAMVRVLEAMPVSQLLAVGERLRGAKDLVDARLTALRRGTDDVALPVTTRTRLHVEIAEALVEAGRPGEAAAELRTADVVEIDRELQARLFEMLLLAEEWDEAARLEPEAEAWMAALDRRIAGGDQSADSLLAEIERRFGADLEPDVRGELDEARGRLAVEPPDDTR